MVTHIGTQELATQRLILRRFTREDAETVYANWANDPEVTRFLRWQAHTSVEQTREMVDRWVKAYESDEKYLWGIELKGGELIGSIACGVDARDDRGETGYCIGRAFWKKGYTAEALRAVIDFMFARVGLNRVGGAPLGAQSRLRRRDAKGGHVARGTPAPTVPERGRIRGLLPVRDYARNLGDAARNRHLLRARHLV